MPELKTVHRVTVYTDASLETHILNLCERLGARGYTVLAIRDGKGGRTAVQGKSLSGPNRLRIETVVDRPTGEKLLAALASDAFAQRPVLACMEAVEVMNNAEY